MFTDRKNNRFQKNWIMQNMNKLILNTAPPPITDWPYAYAFDKDYMQLSLELIHIFHAWDIQRVYAIYKSYIWLMNRVFFKLSSCHTKQIYSEIKSKRKAKLVFYRSFISLSKVEDGYILYRELYIQYWPSLIKFSLFSWSIW
jgi:hypothetical protein